MNKVTILQRLKNVLKEVHSGAVGDHKVSNRTRAVASLGLSLSGLLLFLDIAMQKLGLEFPMPSKFSEAAYPFEIFLWLAQLVVTPILIMFWSYFRPYLYAYLLPLFCYFTQVHYILIGTEMTDDTYLGWYSAVITLALFIIMLIAKKIQTRRVQLSLKRAKEKIEEIKNA